MKVGSALIYGSQARIIAVLILWLASICPPSYAQIKVRSVQGTVTDSAGKPIKGAAVLVKNLETLRVRSFITRDDGHYHITRLRTDADYEIKAHAQGHWSSPSTLSKFDSSAMATMNLEIDLNR